MEGGIKRPQPDLSFDELYKQAQASAPMLENIGQSILDRLKTQNPEMFEGVIFEMGPIKTRDRALDKIKRDYDGDFRQIKDLVRGRFVVDTPEQIAIIKKAIIDELDIDSMKDKYLTEKIHDNYAQIKSGAVQFAGETAESLTNAVQKTKQFLAGWFDGKPALDVEAAFKALPDSVTPDMPPEVAALVEVKASRELFAKHFTEIEKHGGLHEVQAYIDANPQEAKQPLLVAENHSVPYIYPPVPGLR